MPESGQDNTSLAIRKPSTLATRETETLPTQAFNWEDALNKATSFNITQLALSAARGEIRVPGAILPGLTLDIVKSKASAVVRYGFYAIEASSLFYENRDGYMDDTSTRKRAEEMVQFYTDPKDGRMLYDTYFQEEAKRTNTQLPQGLQEILKDPHKLQQMYHTK